MKKKESKTDVCSHKHSIFLDNFIRRIFQNPLKIIGSYIKEGDVVMDIGCGSGFFTIDMAKVVGPKGRVYAVDLQKEMLSKLETKIRKHHFEDRVVLHNCNENSIALEKDVKADFVLAFYMVHETPDHKKFLAEIKSVLKPGGKFLIVEPVFHVSKKRFEQFTQTAIDLGYSLLDKPPKKGGRSLLLSVANG